MAVIRDLDGEEELSMFESVPFKGESVKMKRKRLAKFFGWCGASWASALSHSSVDSSAISLSATADEEEEQSMLESKLFQGVSRKRKLKRLAKFLDWWVVSWSLALPYSLEDFYAINTIRNRDDEEEPLAVSESVLCTVASTKRKRRRLPKLLARWMLYHWLWRIRVRSIRGVCRKGFYRRTLKKLI